MSVPLVLANSSLPQTIQVTDPQYHARDLRLIWDAADIQRKLSTEQKYATAQIDRPNYEHPIKRDVTGHPDKPDFYHLCISRGERDKEIEQETIALISGRRVGIAYSQNAAFRSTMEDEHLAASGIVLLQNNQKVYYELYAIFDGHGGRQSATYAQTFFQSFFDKELMKMNPQGLTDMGIWNALKATFVHLDAKLKEKFFITQQLNWNECEDYFGIDNLELFEDFNNKFKKIDKTHFEGIIQLGEGIQKIISTFKQNEQKWLSSKLGRICLSCLEKSGCTAIVSVKIGEQLWTANVGDSRAVLKIGDEITELSEDAKVDVHNRFYPSVLKRGGYVLENRINGLLAVARSLNDSSLTSSAQPGNSGSIKNHQYYVISPRPKITLQLLPKGKPISLLLGCDGLWEVPSVKDVAHVLGKDNATKTAFHLVRGALEAKRVGKNGLANLCRDNVTAMVIDLSEKT